jgi:nicotinamidase/pyrazinamidase
MSNEIDFFSLEGSALLIIDVQKDFCPGGRLAIKGGNDVVPVLNRWIKEAAIKNIPIYASRDWHPIRHISFKGEGGAWPVYCIEDSDGAAFHPLLELPYSTIKITKGVRLDRDQNSAFDETGLAIHLQKEGIKELWIGGLALDVCVLATILDAREENIFVNLVSNATRPVDYEEGKKALAKIKEAGVNIV